MVAQIELEFFWWKSHGQPCREAKTIKGSIKTKWKAEIVSISVSSKANVHNLGM